jgi:dihydropteroate synthase
MHLALGARRYDVTSRALVMGILNRTTDSFFDAGRYYEFDAFLRRAEEMVAAGADILDIGGIKAAVLVDDVGPFVSEDEELDRVVPAVGKLASRFDIPLSVDTFRASVAKASFDAGAVIGNDISGFADPDYLHVCADAGASVVATHRQPRPGPGTPDAADDVDGPVVGGSIVDAVRHYLQTKADDALAAGVDRDRIMIDAGLDLGKSPAMSVELVHGTPRLAELGYPVLLAASNKDVLGWLHGTAVGDRQNGTNSAHALGVGLGCRILRAHDVRAARRVCETISAILEAE